MEKVEYTSKYDKSWALVIGINRYEHATQLAIACNDATSVRESLTTQFAFPMDQVIFLVDEQATGKAIMEQYLAFVEKCKPDDRLVVFYAGHGTTITGTRGPVGYLVPVDGRLDNISTLIRWDEFTRSADLIPAKHILFIMDACYSGLAMQRGAPGGEHRFVTDMMVRPSRQVITAGKADETVADGGGTTGMNSIFTGYLLEGLGGKAADQNGVMTASQLMNYVYHKVANDSRSRQTPHFGHIDGDGDFILRTPHSELLNGGGEGDYLVKAAIERPEIVDEPAEIEIKQIFAKKNGYEDPEQANFGKNEWTNKLGVKDYDNLGHANILRPSHWLSIVVEPISNQKVTLDIARLCQELPRRQMTFPRSNRAFHMPSQAITTAQSLILFEPERGFNDLQTDCGKPPYH